MKYSTLLFDNDNTIMDFYAAEHAALKKTFLQQGVVLSDRRIKEYSEINTYYWKQFEKGAITKPEVLTNRFVTFIKALGIQLDYKIISKAYAQNLGEMHFVFEGAEELLDCLKSDFDMYLVTNGVEQIQRRRLNESGIERYFLDVFISEKIGFQKPQKEYFDAVFKAVREKDKSKILIIGDSLTSDIRGGINSGIDTCLFNCVGGKENTDDIVPRYVVHNYNELKELLYK